jgi:hypothetical protein
MSTDREPDLIRQGPAVPPVVRLACTACQLVWEPELADFGTGRTGCPRCNGWTWIAQLGTGPADVGGVR